MELSIISPAYCEELHVENFITSVSRIVSPYVDSYEIIIVDDGSTDKTWTLIEKIAKINSHVKGVRLSRNFGQEAALAAGLNSATGEAAITIDIDFQHPLELLPEMIRLWKETGAEIVEAIKIKRQPESVVSSILIKLFYFIFSKSTEMDLYGATDYKLLSRKAIDAWQLMGENALFFKGMSSWIGFKRIGIPFEPDERLGDKSKWTWIARFQHGVQAITLFSSKPLLFVWLGAIVFFLFAIVLGVTALVQKIMGIALEGFTTVILVQLILGSAVLSALGLITLYLNSIFQEVKQRPRYIIDQQISSLSNNEILATRPQKLKSK